MGWITIIQATVHEAKAEVPISVEQLAMRALSVPRFEKSLLRWEECHHSGVSKRSNRMVCASFAFPKTGTVDSTIWHAPSDLGQGLADFFFPGSVLMPNGRRYHQSNALAKKFLCMAAVLEGVDLFLDQFLPTKHYKPVGDYISCVARGGPLGTARTPLAALMRSSDGSWAFSFVTVQGACVGRRISLQVR